MCVRLRVCPSQMNICVDLPGGMPAKYVSEERDHPRAKGFKQYRLVDESITRTFSVVARPYDVCTYIA